MYVPSIIGQECPALELEAVATLAMTHLTKYEFLTHVLRQGQDVA